MENNSGTYFGLYLPSQWDGFAGEYTSYADWTTWVGPPRTYLEAGLGSMHYILSTQGQPHPLASLQCEAQLDKKKCLPQQGGRLLFPHSSDIIPANSGSPETRRKPSGEGKGSWKPCLSVEVREHRPTRTWFSPSDIGLVDQMQAVSLAGNVLPTEPPTPTAPKLSSWRPPSTPAL